MFPISFREEWIRRNLKYFLGILVQESNVNRIEIYKRILVEIGDEEHYAQLFYESTSVLLSNLIRNLVTESIENYTEFISRYDKENNRLPDYIV